MSVVPRRLGALEWLSRSWSLAILLLASATIVIAALYLAGASPATAVWHLLTSTLGNARAVTGTFREVTPLLLSGIAVLLTLRAGLFNIGVEGQFTVGALACAAVAIRVPGIAGVGLGTLAGITTGALWSLPAGLIKAYKGGHEVITTIMLNTVAGLISTALVAGPLRDPAEGSPTTEMLAPTSRLPSVLTLGELQVNLGLLVGLALAVGLWWWLKRTVAGYELQAVGANAPAARFAGIDDRKVIVRAMTWSGAIAGLAGAVQVLAFEFHFYPGFSSGYGFDALGVAILAGSIPLALIPSAVLFGILNRGGTAIQVQDQVPKGITTVILGLLIIIAAAIRYRPGRSSDA